MKVHTYSLRNGFMPYMSKYKEHFTMPINIDTNMGAFITPTCEDDGYTLTSICELMSKSRMALIILDINDLYTKEYVPTPYGLPAMGETVVSKRGRGIINLFRNMLNEYQYKEVEWDREDEIMFIMPHSGLIY